MTAKHAKFNRTWTVAEAKARLSEILRLAEAEGPQYIGRRKTFVIVPERLWHKQLPPRKPLGQWLVENMPCGIELEVPSRRDPDREIPFSTGEDSRSPGRPRTRRRR